MSESTLLLHLPALLYQRLQRLSVLSSRPIESVVLQTLNANVQHHLDHHRMTALTFSISEFRKMG